MADSDTPANTAGESAYSVVVDDEGIGGQAQELHEWLQRRVVGQANAAGRVAKSFAVCEAGLNDITLPMGAYFMAGPTGVGKTHIAKEIARCLIADRPDAPMTSVECGSLIERHQVTALTGSPPGYVRSDEIAPLAQLRIDGPHFWVKAKKHLWDCDDIPGTEEEAYRMLHRLYRRLQPFHSVVLFDEFEKAHSSFYMPLLHILGDARLQMSDGSTTSFANSFILLTSNIGGSEQQAILRGKSGKMGFSLESEAQRKDEDARIREKTIELIEQRFPREFVGRLRGKILVFRSLKRQDCAQILDLLLEAVRQRVSGAGAVCPVRLSLEFSDEFKTYLLDKGVSPLYGVRPLRQLVSETVTESLAKRISKGALIDGDAVLFTLDDHGEPLLRRAARTPAPPSEESSDA